ncbi:Smr/MutS family protein [Candidatus Pseudoruminococcus sp.]|uniref:Smr/MutS family protein n=1 Tax=Candidatus Pseudoruminococcus sp. TaxID=3101048 RepID=UPI003999E982
MPYSIEIDLHGHTVESARSLITSTLKTLPKDVREVSVIHGYRGGTALRNMVSKYSNTKIERKILGLNQGVTIFVIKR